MASAWTQSEYLEGIESGLGLIDYRSPLNDAAAKGETVESVRYFMGNASLQAVFREFGMGTASESRVLWRVPYAIMHSLGGRLIAGQGICSIGSGAKRGRMCLLMG